MGFNTTVVVLNDAVHLIEADAEFGKNLASAIRQVQRGEPVDVAARSGLGIHCNAATVIESHHADYDVCVRVGGNRGEVVRDPAPQATTPAAWTDGRGGCEHCAPRGATLNLRAEPVAWLYQNRSVLQAFTSKPPPGLLEDCTPLYASPPQARDLSDEEIDAIRREFIDEFVDVHPIGDVIGFARAILAAATSPKPSQP